VILIKTGATTSQTSPGSANEDSKESTESLSSSQNGLKGLGGDAKEIEGAKLVQVDSVMVGGLPYSWLTFEVNGQTEKYCISDIGILSAIRQMMGKCFIPDVQRHISQSPAAFSQSALLSHNARPIHPMQDG
jgi:hypothetical protein